MKLFTTRLNRDLTLLLTVVVLVVGQGSARGQTTSFPTASGGTGTSEAPFVISTTEDLDLLASDVNSGNNYQGIYFKLGTDIKYSTDGLGEDKSNYTAIGSNSNPFMGHFDGRGYVVSGIRIRSTANYQGLFGEIGSGAEVNGIILINVYITGAVCTGGIAGRNNGGVISECFVENDVTIGTVSGNVTCHGGIVGNIINGGRVSGCASKAKVEGTSTPEGDELFGGVVGQNNSGTIENCLYLGNTVEGAISIGAIVGSNYSGSTVKNSYYTASGFIGKNGTGTAFTFDNNNNNPSIGSNSGNTQDVRLAPLVNQDNSDFLALMAARNTALAKVSRTPALDTTVDLTLNRRTLYKDGSWNTICLPFSMTAEQVTAQLAPAALKTLSSTGLNGTTLTLTFMDATAIVAGTPYIIQWASGDNLVNPVFTGVTVGNATAHIETTYADFIGTYKPVSFASGDNTKLLVGSQNKLYYPKGGASINAFRGYFQLASGLTVGDANAPGLNIVLNFGDGETTSLTPGPSLTPVPSPKGEGNFKGEGSEYWYDLSGRRIESSKLKKGVYIHNGRKVVIK